MESTRINDLEVHIWRGARPEAPVVIAAHGITSNGLVWTGVARLLAGQVTLVAPDLRGRAGSRDASEPYGFRRHSDDLVGILDALGVGRALLVGHSMGALVAAVAAVRHPARSNGVVLVDSGPPLTIPGQDDVRQLLAKLLGPAIDRLSMTFQTHADYVAYWRSHPAFRDISAPWLDGYLEHDLVGPAPFRSSCKVHAVDVDGEESLVDAEARAAFGALKGPGVLLLAERGIMDQPNGLYSEKELVDAPVPVEVVSETNHYSIVMGDKGAAVVANHILAMTRRA